MKVCAVLVTVLFVASPLVFGLEAICTDGACCSTDGQFLSNDTVCRPAANECDAPDYCTGSSSQCQIDISIREGAPCGKPDDLGNCVDGFCWNSAVKAKVKHCEETCSKINGNCSQNGTCVCYEPWVNPPYCNSKNNLSNNIYQSNENDYYRDMEVINNITAKRMRRSSGNKHHQHANHHHHHKPKPVALPVMVQDPPTEDTWTRYKQNPLFIPIVVTIIAFIVLLVFGIWASALYRSELQARKIKSRIKVNKSRRHVSKDTSIINDPSVSIDVGH